MHKDIIYIIYIIHTKYKIYNVYIIYHIYTLNSGACAVPSPSPYGIYILHIAYIAYLICIVYIVDKLYIMHNILYNIYSCQARDPQISITLDFGLTRPGIKPTSHPK